MKKGLIQGIAGVGLLVLLPSCNTQKQTTGNDVYAIARTTQSGPGQDEETEIRSEQLSRNIVVPQLQIDALSVYKRMITYYTGGGNGSGHVGRKADGLCRFSGQWHSGQS